MTHRGTRLHAALYRLTRGRLLSSMGGRPVLVLETIGRRTQQRRATPVQYLSDGDEFVVVASDRGAARPPAWYLNLRARPSARVQVGARTIDVHARETSGHDRAELWRRLSAADRSLERAAAKAGRELPLIALTPTDRGAGR
jgi:deazaflavin-dependent oxidoreductase (nitroreductase family)